MLSAVDWILLAVLGLSLLLGVWRGIVQEVLSLAGWVVAFYVSQLYAPLAAAWLPMEGSSQMLRYAAGFVVVFIAVLVATVLVSWVVKKLVSAVGLGLL
ncbi:MAG: CvpA family protein, partial [Limnohabitans sp.]